MQKDTKRVATDLNVVMKTWSFYIFHTISRGPGCFNAVFEILGFKWPKKKESKVYFEKLVSVFE